MTAGGVGALRRVAGVVVSLLLVVAVLVVAAGWYFSGEIRRSALLVPPQSTDVLRELEVTAAGPGTVAVRGDAPALDSDKTYGLDWGSGYGRLGKRLPGTEGDGVRRELTVLSGRTPFVGQPARLAPNAFPADPPAGLAVPVREVTYRSPAGELDAWLAPGTSTTWAVLTHGRGATRDEVFRLMQSTSALGLPSLAISYRRDPEAGGGLAQFGQDEWEDLEAAVQYALDSGARRVVLLGCSMGGSITASFLERSPLADRVAAVVLDSPMLDLAATVEHGAAQRPLPLGLPIPDPVTATALRLAGWRFDLRADEVDYLDDTSWVTVPTLVLHGEQDATVPSSVSARLAAAEPALVRYVPVAGADHVESWNVDPARYEAAVRDFLAPYA